MRFIGAIGGYDRDGVADEQRAADGRLPQASRESDPNVEKISLARLILATDPNVEKISHRSKCGKMKTCAR